MKNAFRIRSIKRISSLTLAMAVALALISIRHFSQAGQSSSKPRAARKPVVAAKNSATSLPAGPATIQTLRNIGKAYYEQGKYPECAGEFQKVIASGHALATDHMDLALGLMQQDKLDEALGEMTTAKQMDPKLVAVDYNLGILYKRESRYPEAEAALKRVIANDADEPSAWLNLGVVYFSQAKLQDAMAAYQHLLDMGFGRGQNFYVAGLFRMSTALFRQKRIADAQKYLALHAKVKDKVPSVSVQTAALEGGKYGAILVPNLPPTNAELKAGTERITFADITSKLGIHLPERKSAKDNPAANLVEMSKSVLFSQHGASIAVGDYDSDGHPDLYFVLPEGTNHLFHNNGDGTFSDVTARADVAGPGIS